MPELLISVRNAEEARIALEGGCSWLDVKEPARGSLGCADPATWSDVAHVLNAYPNVPGSLALGELCEFDTRAEQIALPEQYTHLKIGLAGIGQQSYWVNDWLAARQRITSNTSHPVNWVAVVYADWQAARSPAPEEIIAAATQTDCAAVLFDTYHKNGNSLWDYLNIEQLQTYRQQIQQQNMRMAVAGGITMQHLPKCVDLQPDIIGIRGAVCDSGKREEILCRQRIHQIVRCLCTPTVEAGS